MTPEKFNRLAENIRQGARLESLPFTFNEKPDDTSTEFLLISGHHRVRAARKGGLLEIFILNDQNPMTRSEMIAKQLAHNSLAGYDDKQLLAQLYREIDDIANRIASGVTELDLKIPQTDIKVDALAFQLDYELINLLFIAKECERFRKILDSLAEESSLYIADKADFDKFRDAAQKMKRFHDVRNAAGIVAKMLDIVHFYLAERGKIEPGESWVPLAAIFGTDSIPEGAAKVIKDAVAKMRESGNVREKNLWQAVEMWAADFLAA